MVTHAPRPSRTPLPPPTVPFPICLAGSESSFKLRLKNSLLSEGGKREGEREKGTEEGLTHSQMSTATAAVTTQFT